MAAGYPDCCARPRSYLYCHRSPCGHGAAVRAAEPAAIDLPRPTVEVVHTDDGKSHVVVSRDGKGRSYEVVGTSPDEKVKDAVEKVISDKYTGEWLP